MNQLFHFDLTIRQILLYNIVLFAFLIYFLVKNRRNKAILLIVFLFFHGFFSDISSYVFGGTSLFNLYKISMMLWATYLMVGVHVYVKDKYLLIFFLFFSIYYVLTSIVLNGDKITLVFSQYSKFYIPTCLFFKMRQDFKDEGNIQLYNVLFKNLLLSQIFLGVYKLLLLRGYLEGWVGSLSGAIGGGVGTSLPLLGLAWYVGNSGSIKYRVLFLVGLLFVGFMAGKRAIWFLFPIFFLLFNSYVGYRKISVKRFLSIVLLTVLFGYLGLRLSPTLNPEGRVWGSFDLKYAYNYVMHYSTGMESTEEGIKSGQGRVGAVKLILNDIGEADGRIKEVLFGLGNEYFVYAEKEDYSNSKYYKGINHRGSITGFVQMYITIGLVGVILFLSYFLCFFNGIKSKRMRNTVLLMVLLDFIFYNAQMVYSPALQTLLLFVLLSFDYFNRTVRT